MNRDNSPEAYVVEWGLSICNLKNGCFQFYPKQIAKVTGGVTLDQYSIQW